MALVRWEPAREVSSLQTEMNRLFNTFFEPSSAGISGAAAPRWIPAMDLVESDDSFVLKADLPGVRDEDVHVEVDGDVLTITGERKSEHRESGNGYVRVERGYGSFRRSVSLPDGIDPERVAASFERGVLSVRIPKPEQRKPHRVEIAGGETPTTIDAGTEQPAAAGATE